MAYMHKIPGLAMLVDVMRREDEQAFMAEQEAIKLAAMQEEGDEERAFRAEQLNLEHLNRWKLENMQQKGFDKQRSSTEGINKAGLEQDWKIAELRAATDLAHARIMAGAKDNEMYPPSAVFSAVEMADMLDQIDKVAKTPAEATQMKADLKKQWNTPVSQRLLGIMRGSYNQTKVEQVTTDKKQRERLVGSLTGDISGDVEDKTIVSAAEKIRVGLGWLDALKVELQSGSVGGYEPLSIKEKNAQASSMKLKNIEPEVLEGIKAATEVFRKDAPALKKIFLSSLAGEDSPEGFGVGTAQALAYFYKNAAAVSNAPEADWIRRVMSGTTTEDKDLRELFRLALRLKSMTGEQGTNVFRKSERAAAGREAAQTTP